MDTKSLAELTHEILADVYLSYREKRFKDFLTEMPEPLRISFSDYIVKVSEWLA